MVCMFRHASSFTDGPIPQGSSASVWLPGDPSLASSRVAQRAMGRCSETTMDPCTPQASLPPGSADTSARAPHAAPCACATHATRHACACGLPVRLGLLPGCRHTGRPSTPTRGRADVATAPRPTTKRGLSLVPPDTPASSQTGHRLTACMLECCGPVDLTALHVPRRCRHRAPWRQSQVETCTRWSLTPLAGPPPRRWPLGLLGLAWDLGRRLSGRQRHTTGPVSDGLHHAWSARRPMAQHLHEQEDITNDTVAPLAPAARAVASYLCL